MTYNIVSLRKVWFALSGILIASSIAAVAIWGLRLGIDFTGGSMLNIRFANRPANPEIVQIIHQTGVDVGEIVVQPVGTDELQIRTKTLSQADDEKIVMALQAKFSDAQQLRFDAVGPVIGAELRQKSTQGIVIALLLILLYIAYVFRKVSAPIASWKYGLVTMIAAMHDILIPVGVFAVLGNYLHYEIGTSFVAAMLTILGYSITDTIVVMDRVRENLPRMKAPFADIVSFSLSQTYIRSLYTSLTTLIVLFAIFFFGGASLHEFTLAMIIGIVVGTYSSIFVAPMLLVSSDSWTMKKRAK
ncbi:protein translocase subunit SecF [Patescibacteria group bacterium]|nr:protein translocase subunit SecF [Patescibacteria group bacterium]